MNRQVPVTASHKIQPNQRMQMTHQEKMLAKRAAAKVVRKKINESASLTKSSIVNQSKVEQAPPSQPVRSPMGASPGPKKPTLASRTQPQSDQKPLLKKKIEKEEYKQTQPVVAGYTAQQRGTPQDQRQQTNGDQSLKQKMEMRMRGDGRAMHMQRASNATRSFIEDASEDFTNIEEHIQEDTRLSCRNMVDSVIYKKKQSTGKQSQSRQPGHFRENRSSFSNNQMPSHQASKEDTFETSSFFDEKCGAASLRGEIRQTMGFDKQGQQQPTQVQTIFNHLYQGINEQPHNQGSNNRPVSSLSHKSGNYVQSNEPQVVKPKSINNFVTKVEKNQLPIKILDNVHVKKEQKPNSSSLVGGRSSQLKMISQTSPQQPDLPKESTQDQRPQISTEGNQDDCDESEESVKEVNAANSELHRSHLIQTLQSLQYIKTLPPVAKREINKRSLKLPNYRSSHIKKTLIFDLDETLVHCIDDIENNVCDQEISVTFPTGETVQAGINIRPYAIECLKKANENYQVVVFTASHKAYADVVLDILDPKRTLIQQRLYRDHCIRTQEGIYIKDLRIIQNRPLKDMIIVDNAVYSFGYQLDNGIPIIPFYEDKNDEELMHLIFYIDCLAKVPDVREQNRKAFQLKDLQEVDLQEYMNSIVSQGSDDQS